jgi:hypothetical protein
MAETTNTTIGVPKEAVSRHERYLRGLPLTEEEAAKAAETAAMKVLPWPGTGRVDDVERELTRRERQALRELRESDGWPVLIRLQEKIFHESKKSAISLSEANPLANGDEIAQKWAYTMMMRAAALVERSIVEAEVKQADEEQG